MQKILDPSDWISIPTQGSWSVESDLGSKTLWGKPHDRRVGSQTVLSQSGNALCASYRSSSWLVISLRLHYSRPFSNVKSRNVKKRLVYSSVLKRYKDRPLPLNDTLRPIVSSNIPFPRLFLL